MHDLSMQRGGAHAVVRADARPVAYACAGVVAALILLLPAFWNGFALLQYDTGGYLARWYEGTLVPSRPGAYGLLLAASVPLDFWPTLCVQAALTVWVLALTLRAHGLGGRPLVLLGLTAFLSAATTLPWLASILLTDIFAGLAVLALHLVMLRGETLGRGERAGLVALVAFAAASHSATLVVLAGLVAAGALAALLRRAMVPRDGLVRGVAALGLGIAVTLTANFAVAGRVMWTPGGTALLFGRMLQDGIVSRYLDDHCPDPRLRLCMYRAELPHDADTWFWGSDLFDQMGRFAGMNGEMETIVLASLTAYPGMQAETAAVAAAKQLVSVASGEGVVNWIWHTYAIMQKFTPSVVPAMRAARQQMPGIYIWPSLNRVHRPVALVAMLLLPAIIVLGFRQSGYADLGLLAATVAVTLLANAVVCGVLSNPHDRYGARMAWLAVLAVGIAGFRATRRDLQRPA